MAYPNYQMYQNPYAAPYMYQSPYQPQPMPQQGQQPQPVQQPMQQQVQQPVQPQIQNGGIMIVRTEEEAYNWPIAPGVGMMFKVENKPVFIDKSRGFSPIEAPVTKTYDMIERVQQQTAPVAPQEAPAAPAIDYAERADVEAIRREMEAFKAEFKADLDAIKNQPIVAEIKRTTSKAKKEAEE